MNILFFSHDSSFYGAPQALFELVNSLQKNFHYNCIVITPRHGKLNEKLTEVGVENFTIKYHWSVAYRNDSGLKKFVKKVRKLIITLVAWRKLKKKIKNREIDVIYTNTSVIDIGVIISKLLKRPHIWHVREFIEEHFGFQPLVTNYFKYMEKNSSVIIAISQIMQATLIKKGISSDKIKLIYDGLDQKKYLYKEREVSKQKKINAVFLGHISELKGQLHLVKAIALLPDEIKKNLTVDFYGDYENLYYQTLLNCISENRLSKIFKFNGYSNNVNEILHGYDIGIVCSKFEGFGRVTVEYMLSGVCPIVSNTGANPELVVDGINGYLYQYGDINDLSKVIQRVWNEYDILPVIAQRGRSKAEQNFTLYHHLMNVENIIRTVEA